MQSTLNSIYLYFTFKLFTTAELCLEDTLLYLTATINEHIKLINTKIEQFIQSTNCVKQITGKRGKLLQFVSQSIEIHLASFNDHSNAVLLSWPTLASWILYLGYLFGQTIVTSCYQASIKSLSKNIHVTWSTAACILTRTNEGNHISFILLSLHWLPGKFRLEFKIPLLICKTLNDKLYHVLMSS